jgi:hypothetical protein
MILYVNGDSHTAAAEAVNPHAFAEDDSRYFYLGRAPHPDNLLVSWGKLLSLAIRCGFHCDAESASSNARIVRTTRTWLAEHKNNLQDILVVIQWSTWEREEWEYNSINYQVNGSGIDQVPVEAAERYRNYVIGLNWRQKTEEAHNDIWQFHQELLAQNISHVFFNGNNDFSSITDQKDWGTNYIRPYDSASTYHAQLQSAGIETVMPDSYHYGRDGHSWWFKHILNYLMSNKFI